MNENLELQTAYEHGIEDERAGNTAHWSIYMHDDEGSLRIHAYWLGHADEIEEREER